MVGIHAVGVRLKTTSVVVGKIVDRLSRQACVADHALLLVGFESDTAEHLREPPLRQATNQIHLKHAVGSVLVAEGKKGVGFIVRPNLRDAQTVESNRNFVLQPVQSNCPVGHRQ